MDSEKRLTLGQKAYEMREQGDRWVVIGIELGYSGWAAGDRALQVAKRYALTHGLPWPPRKV